MKKIDQKLLQKILNDQAIRSEITKNSIEWFFHVYLPHYIKYPPAQFHEEMFHLIENEDIRNITIVAFRGSAKSTIMNLAYPLWAVLGKQKKKFILIVGQTQQQAKQHLKNIKEELENNKVLRMDLGPFQEEEMWSSYTLIIPKYQARIMAVSMEQSIRGIRHAQHRPDLIICDDIEDLASVKTREGRDKTHQWLLGEVLPTGDQNTRIVTIGNLLHEDSLVMRIKKAIEAGSLDGIFKSYPLLDEAGKCLWPGKYPTQADIEAEKRRIGNESAWHREYLLNIVSDQERLVHPEWIHYYDELPQITKDFYLRKVFTGVDLAISQTASADYTAMVSGRLYGYYDEMKVYILPNPVNEKLTFPQTVEKAKSLSLALGGNAHHTQLLIEDVGYQRALIEQLQRENVPAEGFKLHGQDKRTRIALTTHLIQQGKVLFPSKGCEKLIEQLTGFGLEKHDDLADAFSLLILKIMSEHHSRPQIIWLGGDSIAGNMWDRIF